MNTENPKEDGKNAGFGLHRLWKEEACRKESDGMTSKHDMQRTSKWSGIMMTVVTRADGGGKGKQHNTGAKQGHSSRRGESQQETKGR